MGSFLLPACLMCVGTCKQRKSNILIICSLESSLLPFGVFFPLQLNLTPFVCVDVITGWNSQSTCWVPGSIKQRCCHCNGDKGAVQKGAKKHPNPAGSVCKDSISFQCYWFLGLDGKAFTTKGEKWKSKLTDEQYH